MSGCAGEARSCTSRALLLPESRLARLRLDAPIEYPDRGGHARGVRDGLCRSGPLVLWRGSHIGAIERLHRVLTAAHCKGVMAQSYDRVLVAGELGDEANFDTLRLKR